jgi:intergrase/recombinase
MGGRSLVWSRTSACHDINWSIYRDYLNKLYGKQYVSLLYSYATKYHSLLTDTSKISALPISIRSNVLKALISLSKYLGIYQEFTTAFKNHGIKWTNGDSFKAFLSIVNNHNDTVLEWFRSATKCLKDHEKLYLRFVLLSGLRKNESIQSFNMIIRLANENRLSEYYDSEKRLLLHFRFDRVFLRGSKNTYISAIDPNLIKEIANSKTVSYNMIRKRLKKTGLTLRIKECRSFYATYLRNHNVLAETIDTFQGRVPKSVFARNYMKLDLKAVSDQILGLVSELANSI